MDAPRVRRGRYGPSRPVAHGRALALRSGGQQGIDHREMHPAMPLRQKGWPGPVRTATIARELAKREARAGSLPRSTFSRYEAARTRQTRSRCVIADVTPTRAALGASADASLAAARVEKYPSTISHASVAVTIARLVHGTCGDLPARTVVRVPVPSKDADSNPGVVVIGDHGEDTERSS